MNVEVEVSIKASKSAIWAMISDIENAANTIRGIEKNEIVHKPNNGLVGLRWQETRILFGKPATAEKWITDAVDNEFYQTRAESDGFVFLSTTRIVEEQGIMRLISVHDSLPQTWQTKLMVVPMRLFFKGVAKKALLQDLQDIKSALEQA